MIYLRHGERTEGGLTVPIYNFHLLTLRFGFGLGGPEGYATSVVCSRCDADTDGVLSENAIRRAFRDPCPRKDDP